ncbi:MAG: tripartite tricarboxylate transporter substrate-binding protein [Acetobacteraceae bacterium]|nr:tripartite tricarboxylate transporter substrate-binding protein [Acetobacteraceae bacterium]
MVRRRALLAVPALLSATRGHAQTAAFPTRPVRLVIPLPPGGTNDIVGRLIAERMAARLGQNVVVENGGGAGGVIGTAHVASAPGDGHTLLLAGSGSLTITSLVQTSLPYDAARDFAPVGLIGSSANVIVTHPSRPVRTLADLQAFGRASREPLRFATPGAGSTAHALGAMISLALGFPFEYVIYRGTGPALADMLAGLLDVQTNAPAPLAAAIAAGQLVPIAVAGTRRSPVLPEVPTTVEQGFPEIQAATWFGIVAPRGTPGPVRALLHGQLNAILAEPEIQARFSAAGVDIEPSPTPEAFGAFLAEDRERWGRVVRATHLRIQ